MNESFLELLTQNGTKIHLEKNVYLNISRRTPGGNYFYLLEEGICALNSITKKGEEAVFLYFYPKRIIGFNQLLMSSSNRSLEFTIITRTPCTLYRISYDIFQSLLRTSPDFTNFLMQTLADNYYEVLAHFHRRMDESAVTGLCRLLLSVANPSDGLMIVPRFFTYAELAKYLGTHSVTVSRIMAKMKSLGYISKDSRGIILRKPEFLQAVIDGKNDIIY